MHRLDPVPVDAPRARPAVGPQPLARSPRPVPPALAWASAAGSQRVQRLAEAVGEAEADAPTAGVDVEAPEDDEWGGPEEGELEEAELEALVARLEALTSATPAPAEAAEPDAVSSDVAGVQRLPLGRQPRTRTRGAPLTGDDVVDLKRVSKRTIKALDTLESERAITTVEREAAQEAIRGVVRKAKKGKGDRAVLHRNLNRMRALPDGIRKSAASARSTKGKTHVSSFAVTPPVIRVGEHESARISFVLGKDVQSAHIQMWDDPNREGASYRLVDIPATQGYHQMIWDGTWQGMANRAPEPGTYRVTVFVTGKDGKEERLADQIRVENAGDETVLPRARTGPKAAGLTFDGRELVLTDADNNQIAVPAVSGLRPNNPKNHDGLDYTLPEHEWAAGRGPIPHGDYSVRPHDFQVPTDKKGLKFASGGTAAKWGPMRIPILPNQVRNRSEFFIHMDVTNDGTAGCIGIPPGQEGKYNQLMSVIALNKDAIPLKVTY